MVNWLFSFVIRHGVAPSARIAFISLQIVSHFPLLAIEKGMGAAHVTLNCGCFETRGFHSSKTPGFKESKV
jgi:hypothetical protein